MRFFLVRKGEISPTFTFWKVNRKLFQLPTASGSVQSRISWFDSLRVSPPCTTVFFLKFKSPPCSIVQVFPFNTKFEELKSTVAPSLKVLICADRLALLIAWLEAVFIVTSDTSFCAWMVNEVPGNITPVSYTHL